MTARRRTCLLSRTLFAGLAVTFVLLAGCARSAATSMPPAVAPTAEPVGLDAYVASDATLVVRIDLARLQSLPLFDSLIEQSDAAELVSTSPLAMIRDRCGPAWWRGIDDLVVSATDDEHVLVVVATREPAKALDCIASLRDEARRASIGDTEGVELGAHDIAVVRGDRVFAGRRELVLAALEQTAKSAGPTHVLHRRAGSPASAIRLFVGAPPELPLAALGGALDGDEQHFRLLVSLQGRSTVEADQIADDLAGAIGTGLTVAPSHAEGDALRAVLRALSSTEVRRHVGATVGVEVTVEDTGHGQAEALSAFLGFSIGVARGIRQSAITADAQARLADIAARVAAYAEAHRAGPSRLPRLPDSAPATPERMPNGAPALVTAASWSHPTWRELEFGPEGESFFSYEIVTSRDRSRAKIRARGDVDGDGEPALLEMGVRVRFDGQVVIEPVAG